MKNPFHLVTLLILLGGAGLTVSLAQDGIDSKKLRELHQKARSGVEMTAEERAYYEKGKAERQRGGPASAEPKVSTGLVPVCDIEAGSGYKEQDGGLYGGGRNSPPEAHLKEAMIAAAKIQPLDAEGKPSPTGKIVLLTHGMSNTTQESQRFIEIANADPRRNPAVLCIDGAQGGMDSRKWVEDTHTRRDTSPWDGLDNRIKGAGATPQQVQIVWMKHAIARPRQVGDFPKHAKQLEDDTAKILSMLKQRFPNLQIAYLSSRTYGGYATTDLNPEPYAYESAFAVRGVIQRQINGDASLDHGSGKVPLLLWGPYLWADGEKGRKAGDLAYKREDYREDGTHPTDTGRQKVAEQLLRFFTSDPTAVPWFVKP